MMFFEELENRTLLSTMMGETPPRTIPGNLNQDTIVDTQDFTILKSDFGTASPLADINKDGIVDSQDFTTLKVHFGWLDTIDPVAGSACRDWGAPKGFYGDNPLYNNSGMPQFDDVFQGENTGTCWIMASLSALAYNQPEAITNAITPLSDGTYRVRLYDIVTLQPEYHIIDADLYTLDNPWDMVDGVTPFYAKLGKDGALWVALIEKAFAAGYDPPLHLDMFGMPTGGTPPGYYDNIYGDFVANAFTVMTGTVSDNEYVYDSVEMSNKINQYLNEGRGVITWSSYAYGEWIYAPVTGTHAYAVLAATPEYVTVRNPYGIDGIGRASTWDSNPNDGILVLPMNMFLGVFSNRIIKSGYSIPGQPAGADMASVYVSTLTNYGDANNDKKIDTQDFTILKENFGQGANGWANADFNQDSIIDSQDFTLMKNHFGWEDLADPGYNATATYVFNGDRPLFVGQPEYDDVFQGANSGTCWLLSGLSALAYNQPQTLTNAITYLGNGQYQVKLYNLYTMQPEYITIDADLPTMSDGITPFYAKYGNQGELWVSLFEKAFAKRELGGYNSLNGGISTDAFLSIIPSYTGWDYVTTAWQTNNLINGYFGEGRAVVTWAGDVDDSSPLSDLHAYAVLGSTLTTVTVRNPYGVDKTDNNGSIILDPGIDNNPYDGIMVLPMDVFLRDLGIVCYSGLP